MEDAIAEGDIYVTTTGCEDIIRIDHMEKMKDTAIVCNIGHFDCEIQVEKLNNFPGIKKRNQNAGGQVYFPDGHCIVLLAEGRLVNLGVRHRASLIRNVQLLHESGTGTD